MCKLQDFGDMELTCPVDGSTLKVKNVREIQLRGLPRRHTNGYFVHSETGTLEIIPTVSAQRELSYTEEDPEFNDVLFKFIIERIMK